MKINTKKLIDSMPQRHQRLAKFIALKESEADVSTLRIGQEISTNLLPKAVFARSLADLADNGFREIFENIIVYLGPKFVGEKIFRKIYSKNLDGVLKDEVATTAAELLKNKNENNKKLMPIKAAIALSALAIPLAEYSLSYVKNLFTLKLFKQSDFNNIANLNKSKNESKEQQKKVKNSAKSHIKLAGYIFAGVLSLSSLLVLRGKNSKLLNHFSEAILAPGSKFFKNNEKKAAFVNKYFGLDFASKNGKLAMSNGQITACVVTGGFGYYGAAKDRGKQDFKEIAYRFPLVGFYAITGSELFEKGFKTLLKKKEPYKDMIGKYLSVPKLEELGDLAHELATKKGTSVDSEFKRLFGQKSKIVMTPFLFSLGFMGFFVAGMSRYFTQYRYNKDMGQRPQKLSPRASFENFGRNVKEQNY